MTGEFNEEGLIDTIDGLAINDCLDLQQWMEFYEKDYKFIGKYFTLDPKISGTWSFSVDTAKVIIPNEL